MVRNRAPGRGGHIGLTGCADPEWHTDIADHSKHAGDALRVEVLSGDHGGIRRIKFRRDRVDVIGGAGKAVGRTRGAGEEVVALDVLPILVDRQLFAVGGLIGHDLVFGPMMDD